MDVIFDGTLVRAGSEARERFYDSRGYGEPHDGNLVLAPVEAAHLLFRGDLAGVRDGRPDADGDSLGFHELLASAAVSEVSFFVYKELRDRGFYLSPATEPGDTAVTDTTGLLSRGEFVVYPRGHGPWDDVVAYRVRAVSERERISASDLLTLANRTEDGTDTEGGREEATGVLAVVDEESEVTYLELDRPTVDGTSTHDVPTFEGQLLSDRVFVSDPPTGLYEQAFYGQQLDRDERPLQLSLVEAAHLTARGLLRVRSDSSGHEAVLERGRAVEGERFDRRFRTYQALRDAGVVPKTGFKFGADFRTYSDVTDVENLGHSEQLVRVVPRDHAFTPRDLALDVRLAHGVRKRMVFALVGDDAQYETIEWLSVERLTP